MATELKINDNSTWRLITSVSIQDSGTWRDIQQIYIQDNGTWRTVFVKTTFGLVNETVSAAGSGVATASYKLEADGDITKVLNGASTDLGDWVTPTSQAANYEVRATVSSGSTPSGSAVGSWLAMTADRTWTITAFGSPASDSCVLLVELRRASDSVVVDSASITIQAIAV